MSQMGVEGGADSVIRNLSFRNLPIDYDGYPMVPFDDEQFDSAAKRVTVLLIFSVFGLLGNFLTILLVMVTKQLQKPSNSFFMHHCVLDTVKSAFCFIFSKSLLNREPPSDCAILGASYIVFVTTSAFNILAITINELYHFTNEVAGNQPGNKCCVAFGLGIIWFASIIINLGVAFLPANPSFDRAVGYCTFMYGVTGNYLLHVLWIVMITLALLLTMLYLRKFWQDIKQRAYYRIATLFHNTMQLQLDGLQLSEKSRLKKSNGNQAIEIAKKNFFVLVTMVITFIIFWYPLFLLTLSDPLFKADPIYYKTLTIVAWCHSSLTPIFFITYNISSIKDIQEKLIWKHDRQESVHSIDTASPRIYPVTSDSESTPCSPLRPNSLNVTPVYTCHHHLSSGICIGGICQSMIAEHPSKAAAAETPTPTNGAIKTVRNCELRIPSSFSDHRRLTLALDPLRNGSFRQMPSLSKSFDHPRQTRINDNSWLRRASYAAENNNAITETEDKFGKTGSAYNPQRGLNRLEIIASPLPSKSIGKLINSSHSSNVYKVQRETNRTSIPSTRIASASSQEGNLNDSQTTRRLRTSQSLTTHNRVGLHGLNQAQIPHRITIPSYMSIAASTPSSSDMEVQVDSQTSPSTQLTVHSISTSCLTSFANPLAQDNRRWV